MAGPRRNSPKSCDWLPSAIRRQVDEEISSHYAGEQPRKRRSGVRARDSFAKLSPNVVLTLVRMGQRIKRRTVFRSYLCAPELRGQFGHSVAGKSMQSRQPNSLTSLLLPALCPSPLHPFRDAPPGGCAQTMSAACPSRLQAAMARVSLSRSFSSSTIISSMINPECPFKDHSIVYRSRGPFNPNPGRDYHLADDRGKTSRNAHSIRLTACATSSARVEFAPSVP
jgi:hypothetical protein